MANSAVVGVLRALLTANTAQYDQAFKKSTVVTGQFGKATVQLTEQAKRMAAAFSGDKLIARANNLTAAVNQVGGAARLTQAEQRRVNQTLTEAIAKYQALGRTAPAAMIATEKATRQADVATSKWGGTLTQARSVLAAFGVTLSTAAVVSFANALLDTADNLVRVADRTGLTTTEVQKLEFVARQSGNTVDDFTGAIAQLQNRLISGDKSAVNAVKVLGLNFEALRKASPFDQLSQLARAIGEIPDPAARAAVAIDLFGRQGAAILPTLIADFDRLARAAPVMADSTVRSLDQMGDALQLFRAQLHVWAAESFVFASRLFDQFVAFVQRATARAIDLQANVLAFIAKLPGVGALFQRLGIDIAHMREQAQFLRDTADGLSTALDRQSQEVRKTSGALVDYDALLNRAAESTKKVKDESADLVPRLSDLHRWFMSLPPAIEDSKASAEAFKGILSDTFDDAVVKARLLREQIKALNEELQQRGMGPFDFGAHTPNNPSQVLIAEQEEAAEAIRNQWRQVFIDIRRNLTMSISDAFGDMLVGLRGFKEGFLNIWQSIQRAFSNILASMLDSFVESFLKGMIRAIGGANLGESLVNTLTRGALASAIPGGVLTGATATGLTAAGTLASFGPSAGVLAAGTGVGTGAAAGTAATGGGAGATLAGLATNPFTIAAAGGLAVGLLVAKKGLFRGGEEGITVNPRRDQFQLANFGRTGDSVAQAGMRLAAQLTTWSGQPGGGSLFAAMQAADSVKEWERAQAAIVAEFKRHGTGLQSFQFGGFTPPNMTQLALVHGGRMGELHIPVESMMRQPPVPNSQVVNNYNFAIRALDSEDVQKFLEREFWPRHNREMHLNQFGGASSVTRVRTR